MFFIDNASYHVTPTTKNLLYQQFHPCFLPAHSSWFNSIEKYWNVAKSRFRNEMLLQQRELSAQEFLALTKKVFEGVEPDIVDNLTRSNRDQILRYLEKRDSQV